MSFLVTAPLPLILEPYQLLDNIRKVLVLASTALFIYAHVNISNVFHLLS